MTIHNFLNTMIPDKWYKMPDNDTFHNLEYYLRRHFNRTLVRNLKGDKIKRLIVTKCNNCGHTQ